MTFKKSVFVTFLAAVFYSDVIAKTYIVDAEIYSVAIVHGQTDELDNNVSLDVGKLNHGTMVNSNGDVFSQWCRHTYAHSKSAEESRSIGLAGFCTIIDKDGDFLWIWFRGLNAEKNEWGVFNGSGKWLGAIGSGTTEITFKSPDRDSWTITTKGTVEHQ